MHALRPVVTTLCLFVITLAARAADRSPEEDRAVENLALFARISGYVRFFHPSDRASEVDWDKVAILGAETVRAARDRAALRTAINRILRPIAPAMDLTQPASAAIARIPQATGDRLIFWQYVGVRLSERSNIYRQRRVLLGEQRGDYAALFQPATAPAPLVRPLAPDLVLQLPLALPVDTAGQTAAGHDAEFADLQRQLAPLDLKALTPADWRLRVAGVMTVWTVFQHFHPYLDGDGIAWDEALAPALRRALRDPDGSDYVATLLELIARTHDGHGYVYGPPRETGGIPIRVARVEGSIVVTGVADGAPFQKGDVIERLDGVPALDVLRGRQRHAPGSPHLSEFRALNQFGEGAVGSVAQLAILRDGAKEVVAFPRVRDQRGYFFNSVGEFVFPPFAEVRPGIFYVNLYSLGGLELEEKLEQLAAAQGVIFDWRLGGRSEIPRPTKMISPHADIIPHLIAQPVQASPMLVPRVSRPDRAGWTYQESTWPVNPKSPQFKGRIVFINEPSVVSYGETCMAMIADYRLATLVGAPTAGTNGNANYIPLPGGLRVMWTGMDVRKHDRSPFYGVGFGPDVPVARTLRAVRAGRDEYLEAAIAVIEGPRR